MNYEQKYLKYKTKYILLKNLIGNGKGKKSNKEAFINYIDESAAREKAEKKARRKQLQDDIQIRKNQKKEALRAENAKKADETAKKADEIAKKADETAKKADETAK